ncbi:MAG: cell division topological specificity factor MinE [Gammaproteobacteria bacterium]|nr:cell division topological specificity factor MinE [Gammaproteobacteria bacterium]NIR83112.1 cell division topological specificity factor MinE [Gammaproteobacteria bacterium]NIR90774.1 cell division topological specificity factor MinE [Gammaproteobacteria bacterium]NIU04265.1 cell division topological specificity factor MinE [Gammaproteobacteria bacterium]NIV51557.1 cell division topological specificity factor MinE [Gammaproteobacteria bacterium]
MRLIEYFMASRKKSAGVARERLQILVAHERAERSRPSYLPRLQNEILEVIRKYIEIERKDVSVTIDRERDYEVLALSVVLPTQARERLDGVTEATR